MDLSHPLRATFLKHLDSDSVAAGTLVRLEPLHCGFHFGEYYFLCFYFFISVQAWAVTGPSLIDGLLGLQDRAVLISYQRQRR